MKKRRPLMIVPILLVVAAAAAWFWWSGQTPAESGLSGSGTIEAPEVAVAPLVSGRILEAPVSEGSSVKKGDVLFRIDDSVAKLQVAQAEAAVKAAKAALKQAKDDDKSDAEIAAAQAQADQAAAALDIAKLQLSYCTVTSPADGVLLSKALDAGEIASPGRTLATVGQLDELTVTVYVPENRIGKVSVGRRATLSTDSSSDTFVCTVVSVASEAEFTPSQVETKDQRVKLVYAVKLSVTDATGTLKPGMPAHVTFE